METHTDCPTKNNLLYRKPSTDRLWMSYRLHLLHQGHGHLLHRLFPRNDLVQQRGIALDHLVFPLEIPIAQSSLFQSCTAMWTSPTLTCIFFLTFSCIQVSSACWYWRLHPIPSGLLPLFSSTGVSPNKCLVWLIPSWSLLHSEPVLIAQNELWCLENSRVPRRFLAHRIKDWKIHSHINIF